MRWIVTPEELLEFCQRTSYERADAGRILAYTHDRTETKAKSVYLRNGPEIRFKDLEMVEPYLSGRKYRR